jgi:hypothetical protein
VRRQIQPDPKTKAKPAHPDTGTYGTRVNQLFQEAIRDLETLKQAPHHGPTGKSRTG